MSKIYKAKIPNAITSASINHIVATTNDLYDENLKLYQDDINKKTNNNIELLTEKFEETNNKIDTSNEDITNIISDLVDLEKRVRTIEKRYIWSNNEPFQNAVLSFNETPYWKKITYTVSINSNNEEYGNTDGSGSYHEGTIIIITATSNYGYDFIKWSDGSTEPIRKIQVNDDITLTAIFDKQKFVIIAKPDEVDYGSVFGSGVYEFNDKIQIVGITKYGSYFNGWSDGVDSDDIVNFQEPEIDDFVFTKYIRNITVTSDLELIGNFSHYFYTLIYKNSITGEENRILLSYGSIIEKPKDPILKGYTFDKWVDEKTGETFIFGGKIYKNTTLTSLFTINAVEISFVSEDGWIDLSGQCLNGALVKFSAIPSSDMVFQKWLINNEEYTDNNVIVEISGTSINCEATYSEISGDDEYHLLCNTSLNVGDKIIFASSSGSSISTMASEHGKSTNNIPALTGGTVEDSVLKTFDENTAILEVCDGTAPNTISFKINDNYLGVQSNSNQLKILSTQNSYCNFNNSIEVGNNNQIIIRCAQYNDRVIGFNSSAKIFSTYTNSTTYKLFIYKMFNSKIETKNNGKQTISGTFKFEDEVTAYAYSNNPEKALTSWSDNALNSETIRTIVFENDEIYKPLYETAHTLTFSDIYYNPKYVTDFNVDCINKANNFISDASHSDQVQFFKEPFYTEENSGKTFDEIVAVPCFITKENFYSIKKFNIEYCVNNNKTRGIAMIIVDIVDDYGNIIESKEEVCALDGGYDLRVMDFDFTQNNVRGKIRVSIKMKDYSLFFKRIFIYGSL